MSMRPNVGARPIAKQLPAQDMPASGGTGDQGPSVKTIRASDHEATVTTDEATLLLTLLTAVAARSEALSVFARPNIGIKGSNPAQGMDV
jgi:hypothetical protein